MSIGAGRSERDRQSYTWRPGRGFAGGAVTGIWFAAVLALLNAVVDRVGSGWSAGLLVAAAAELLGTLLVAVPVFTLAGGALRSAGRALAFGGYAAAALVARLLLAPLVDPAVGG